MRTLTHDGYILNIVHGSELVPSPPWVTVTAEQYSLSDEQLLGYLIRSRLIPNNHNGRYAINVAYDVRVQPWVLGLASHSARAYLDEDNIWRYESTDMPVEGTVTVPTEHSNVSLVQLTHELHVLAQAFDHQMERNHKLCANHLKNSFADVLKEIQNATRL